MSDLYNPQLDTFLRVADAGSFSKAAEEMYITPTAVIKQINLLEGSLGVMLFIRTHRGLHLTEAGKVFYQDAQYIVEYCQKAARNVQRAAKQDEMQIRIGTSAMTPSHFLKELWPQIHQRCPDIRFEFVTFENTPENAREILGHLGRHIDIVPGVFDDHFLKSRGCSAMELSREPLCCAVPVTHPLSRKEKLSIHDLYGKRLMLIRRGWNSEVDALRDRLLKDHRQIQIVDFDFLSSQMFEQCERTGDLMMTIPYWFQVNPLIRVIPVDWDCNVSFGLFHAVKPSQAVERFLLEAKAILDL